MMDCEKELVSVVNDYVSSGSDESVLICVKQLEVGRVKLVDLVTVLGSALTSSVVADRRRGIQLLTEVVNALPATFFADSEVALLVEFFCARFSDHHSITPLCLSGVAKLLRCACKTLSGEDVVKVLRMIFSDVTVQTLVRADRMLVYELFQLLLTDRLSMLREINAEFVCGFVQAIDSEKDPVNLLVCLNLVETVAKEFTLEDVLAEQLFEVIACYYPVDFSPAPGTSTVTKEQLSGALQNAMTATPLFSPFCLPLLVEKLSSSVADAKIDSLRMFVQCCKVFRQRDIVEHSMDFWKCLKNDVFAQLAVIQDEALKALTALVKCLSESSEETNNSSSQVSSFVSSVFDDCGKYLYDAEQSACRQAGKLLIASCSASIEACQLVLQLTVPVIVSEFHRHVQSSRRQNLLNVLQGLLTAASTVSVDIYQSPMVEYKELVTDVLVSLFINSDPVLRCCAVTGVARLVTMPHLLEVQECSRLLQHLLNVILSDSDPTVVQESIASAVLVAPKHPAAMCDLFLPVLRRILNGFEAGFELSDHVDTAFVLRLLSGISVHPVVTLEATPVLFGYLSSVVHRDNFTLESVHQCCVCLASVVSMMSSDCGGFFIDWLAPRCVALTLHICTASQHLSLAHQLVTELAFVVRTVVQQSKEISAYTFVSSLTSTYLHGDVVKYQDDVNLVIVNFKPLTANFPADQVCSLALLTAAVCSVSFKNISSELLDELMSRLVGLTMQFSDDAAYICACKCLSGLVNRRPSDPFLDDTVKTVHSAVVREISQKNVSKLQLKLKALTLCVWITKALVLRNHSQQSAFIWCLLDCLADAELASVAADGFKLILSDDIELTDGIFSSISGATQTIMYKQRFFTMSLPLLLGEYQSATSEVKSFYVTAFSCLIQFVPRQVLMPEIPRLIPVLLHSLECEEPCIWLNTLRSLAELVADNAEILQGYIDDLLPRVLWLTAYKPLMKVRIAAVRCVAELSVMSVHVILPHQQKVLQQLGLIIDDHKRLVRQEAASARSRWFLVGSSDE